MSEAWKIRAVQLDLARQMETMDFIRGFIDFIAANGYNTLVLYLEGRVRTPSFPYPAARESYSLEEMAAVVAHAKGRAIDVIPVVSTLGHAEMFLKFPAMQHLAELRGGRHGRFSKHRNVFCPSLPETYEFLERYLTEFAAVFPSEYFHAGCDEAWDIGCCELCRERAAGAEQEWGVFARHLNTVHGIVSGKLKKRMLIWDDLFEPYPAALRAIPRDIVMCDWHYDYNIDVPRGHFLNRCHEDTHPLYDQLGIDYLAAPSDSYLNNIKSLSAYAARHHPLGGLLTTWEKQGQFMPQTYPLIAFAGRLWNGKLDNPDGTWAEAVAAVFGVSDPAFANAVAAFYTRQNQLCDNTAGFMGWIDEPCQNTYSALAAVLRDVFAAGKFAVGTPDGAEVLEQITFQLERLRLQDEIGPRVLVHFDPRAGVEAKAAAKAGIQAATAELDRLASRRAAQWTRLRGDLAPDRASATLRDFRDDLLKAIEQPVNPWLLNVGFFLPDQHSAACCALLVKYPGEVDWTEVDRGVFKPGNSMNAFYTKKFALADPRHAEAVRVEVWGYGGLGVTSLELVSATERLAPAAIQAVFGQVSNHDHVLDADLKWCFAGSPNTRETFLNPNLAAVKHGFELRLKKMPGPSES